MPRRWSQNHLDELRRVMALLSKEATPFLDMSREAVAARKALPFAEWCRTYFPHWIQVADAPFHAAADARRNAVGMPEAECWAGGTAKTTRYLILDGLFDVCNQVHLWTEPATGAMQFATAAEVGGEECGLRKGPRLIHLVVGGKTLDTAAEKLNIMRVELKHNARLRSDYGERIEPRDGDDEQTDFTANGVRVLALGTGQSLRGQIFNGRRPQKFIGDDLEDQKIARSRDQEAKLSEWLDEDVFPRLEGVGTEAVFRLLMNMYGRLCQAMRYKAKAGQLDSNGRPLAVYHCYPLLGDDGESTWIARYSTEAVKRAMAVAGPRSARTQYLCLMADETALFQLDWFKTYDTRLLRPDHVAAMRKTMFLDPSAGETETADFKFLVLVGTMPNSEDVFILHAWGRRGCDAGEIVRQIWHVEDTWPDAVLGAEFNGFQKWLYRIYVLMCREAKRSPRLINGVIHKTNKVWDRIIEWQGEVSLGRWHVDLNQGQQMLMVNQFCDLGTDTKSNDDGPDAADEARRMQGKLPWSDAPHRDPTRADELRDLGIERWNMADNPAIWQEVEVG